jgi:hypothetical protein
MHDNLVDIDAFQQCAYTGSIAALSRQGPLSIWKFPSCVAEGDMVRLALFDMKKGK